MKKHIKPILYLFLVSQLSIFTISLIRTHSFSLLDYINISFYISSIFLFTSLIIYTVNTGFFDSVTKSFRLIFAGKDVSKETVNEMRPLSQIITFNYSPILINGILNISFMLLALAIYYI